MRKRIRRYSKRSLIILIIGIILLGTASYLTNPFVRFSLVRDSYEVIYAPNHEFQLKSKFKTYVREGPLVKRFAYLKSGWHILTNRFSRNKKSSAHTLDEIIDSIHAVRFNPTREFLISGDHFSVFYPRSLGIFYHSALDPRTARSHEDWLNRQAIYLKSMAFALDVYSETDHLSTTIVPISRKAVTLMNIYATPSDTLYSLLYGLDTLASDEAIKKRYPFSSRQEKNYTLGTDDAASSLFKTYRPSLVRHWNTYRSLVYDSQTGLVKKNIRLSGTKDMAIRQSAFYDNVIFWSTHRLAQKLGIIADDKKFLEGYKQRIIKEFWQNNKGFFGEDLGNYRDAYSSDWIIAYQTGFLSPANVKDRPYLEQSIAYIRKNKIDRPFGLRYHPDQRPEQLYAPVRFFAPDYGSTAIWSHWGMEYIKLLAHLHSVTDNKAYRQEAQYQLKKYEENIVRYAGYPEAYKSDGSFFRQRFYKSVLTTGWVVNFEQATHMVKMFSHR